MDLPLRLYVRELPPGLNGPRGLERMHWGAKKRLLERWQLLIRAQLKPPIPKFVGEVDMVVVRRRRSGPAMDEDNLHATVKVPQDALQKLGVIENDRDVRLSVTQVVDRERWGTDIIITPRDQSDG